MQHYFTQQDAIIGTLLKKNGNMKLTRKTNKGLFGICEGLGEWSNLSPWLWRIVFIATCSTSWLIYIVLGLCMKTDIDE